MKMLFTDVFKTKTRDEWVYICDGKDSCLTPVLTLDAQLMETFIILVTGGGVWKKLYFNE